MRKAITDIIQIDPALAVPVYKQIVQSIIRNIETGALVKDDVLPSVNRIAELFSLARGSVFTAYNDLRASGLIDSVPGKGYYISSTETKQQKRIFVLLNSFTSYHAALYHTLQSSLPNTYMVHTFFYDNNITTFETLIRQFAGYYNLFLITPISHTDTINVLSQLDAKSIILLENGYKVYRKDFAGVFQNFEKDMYSLLLSLQDKIATYKRLVLITSNEAFTKEIVTGFNKFNKKTTVASAVKTTLCSEDIQKGDAYIVTADDDLVTLVKHCNAQKWILGKDIGAISYNENNLKSVIGQGVTTLSINYEAMGKTVADMILSRKREALENPYIFIDRASF